MSLERIFYRKHPVVEILLSAGRNACCSLGFRHPLPRTPETPVIPCLSVHLDGSRLSPLLFRPWTYRIPIFGFLLPIMSVRADFVHKLCLRHYRKDTDTSKKKTAYPEGHINITKMFSPSFKPSAGRNTFPRHKANGLFSFGRLFVKHAGTEELMLFLTLLSTKDPTRGIPVPQRSIDWRK